MRWDDVNARARGLATHLLSRTSLLRLADARTWEDFVRRLGDTGYPVADERPFAGGTAELNRLVSSVAGKRLALLGRWLGPRRRAVLGVIYEAEERRTIRVLLRGAAQGASPGVRLRALTPTPDLPERVLQRLAHVASPADLARRLVALGHPAGRVLTAELAGSRQLGLFGLEAALGRLFATRVTRAARGGGRLVRTFAAQLVDLENAWTLLLAPNWGRELPPAGLFLSGGATLSEALFLRLAGEPEPARVRAQLGSAFARTPLAPVFAADDADAVRLEGRALGAQIAWHRSLARHQPLGPAVVLGVLQRIRAEMRDLRLVAWGVDTGAPASVLQPHLVTG